jgi:hypothetical protein
MLLYGLYLAIIKKQAGTVRILLGIVTALGLSSVYLMPVIFERVFVHIDLMKLLNYNYENNFLFMHINKSLLQEPPISKIAILDILFFLVSLILLKKGLLSSEKSYFVFLQGLSLFFSIPISAYIWRYFPGFPNLQFPWRWLVFSGLSVAVVSGNIFYKPEGIFKKAIILIVFLMLFLSFYRIAKPFPLADIDFWKNQSVAFAPYEYRPIWVRKPVTILPHVEKVQIEKGGKVVINDWKSNYRLLSVDTDNPARLRLSTFYYPGWQARIDGRRSDIMVHHESGSMIIEIPKGSHTVEITFEDTTVRHYGRIVSLVSLIFICLLFIHHAMKNRYVKEDR